MADEVYRTVAQDIEASKTPYTAEQWRAYYTPQQMTGGTKVNVFNQLPAAPVLTTGNLGTSLYESMYKFNGMPSIKEVKSDGGTINPDGRDGGTQIRAVSGWSKANKKRTRRAVKPNRRKAKPRSGGSKARGKSKSSGTSSKKASSARVLRRGVSKSKYSKMPPGLRKYWENKNKKG